MTEEDRYEEAYDMVRRLYNLKNPVELAMCCCEN
jgi:hypothetical protein